MRAINDPAIESQVKMHLNISHTYGRIMLKSKQGKKKVYFIIEMNLNHTNIGKFIFE